VPCTPNYIIACISLSPFFPLLFGFDAFLLPPFFSRVAAPSPFFFLFLNTHQRPFLFFFFGAQMGVSLWPQLGSFLSFLPSEMIKILSPPSLLPCHFPFSDSCETTLTLFSPPLSAYFYGQIPLSPLVCLSQDCLLPHLL